MSLCPAVWAWKQGQRHRRQEAFRVHIAKTRDNFSGRSTDKPSLVRAQHPWEATGCKAQAFIDHNPYDAPRILLSRKPFKLVRREYSIWQRLFCFKTHALKIHLKSRAQRIQIMLLNFSLKKGLQDSWLCSFTKNLQNSTCCTNKAYSSFFSFSLSLVLFLCIFHFPISPEETNKSLKDY